VLYSGLGWLSGMRLALEVMFVVPRQEQPNFVVGKLRDLRALAVIGATLLVSVALSGAVTGFSGVILSLVGIDSSALPATVLLNVAGRALAIAASTALLMTMFRLLVAESHLPRSALLRGAVLGAVGFEVLKLVANLLLAQTKDTAAFQAFGVALILLVWINYFSRLVMYAAAWAYTDPRARERRSTEALRAPGAGLATGAASDRGRHRPALGILAVGGVLLLRALRRGGTR
jgi:membrane protein